MGKLKKYFRRLRDPRAANASYPLLEILCNYSRLCGVVTRVWGVEPSAAS